MRSEVQELLDKEWPDKVIPRGTVYGASKLFSALARLSRYGQDIGDEELYNDALEEAKKITDPHHDEESKPSYYYKFLGVRNREHIAIHANKPRVFIFKEKHGDWMYDASTAEKSANAVLYTLERRLNEGWILDELPEDVEATDQLDLLKSNKVPETEAGKARKILELARSGKPGCLIIAGKMAYSFLMDRSDYEYERFEVENLDAAKFDLKKEPPF